MKTKLTNQAKIMLLMLRCEYIECHGKLTLKATLGLPAWIWRKWNDLLVAWKPNHKQEVIAFLGTLRDRAKAIRNNSQSITQ